MSEAAPRRATDAGGADEIPARPRGQGLDLKGRLRFRGCGRKGRAVVSIGGGSFWPARAPASSRLIVRFAKDSPVEEAVMREPRLGKGQFPASWQNTGKIVIAGDPWLC
jgi:hypothetical protein